MYDFSSQQGVGMLSPCYNCFKDRQLSEVLAASAVLVERVKSTEMLAESLQKTIDAKDEQIKFLSEYIKSGGTKIFEDC